ncbi:MAG: protein-L-isoaspartate O-methyltransferase [Candidatus Riflebacteria bacterium]|nr:protein-L-isoaspartate O-methyltransferase [Candidatus Riflebacteria bacterium]
MTSIRKEDPEYLKMRFDRFKILLANRDLVKPKDIYAFLLAPREKFCRPWNLARAYDHAYLDIKFGVTISGPHIVGRMTAACDVKPGEKILEIGTGSGYQSAVLSYLTDQVYTVEIIEPLAKETDRLYTELASTGHPEYNNIHRKTDDGYYGWKEHSPYDKIIVTCGLDHIPPALIAQLKVGGAMVIPVGPPGSQVLLMVKKELDEDGDTVITREDVYRGRTKVSFVPFTKKGGGTHYQPKKKE